MDRILQELFGDAEQPTAGTKKDKPADPEREARREARQRRKADAEARRKRRDFVDRYTTGDPTEGFTTEEAVAHLREMREEMSPAEFRRAMQRTIEHLPPDQRDDFIKVMREYKEPPTAPATAAAGTQAAAAAPLGGVLTGLMGDTGSAGVGVDELLADLQKGGLRAPAADPNRPLTEADLQALLNSPLARAVLGGVAAYGMQDLQADDDDHDTPSGRKGSA